MATKGTNMRRDAASKLTITTLTLHWLVGLTIIGLLASGIYMAENKAFALYGIHKSIGVIIFVFIIWRVIWRVMNGWFEPAGDYSTVEKILAKVVHILLLLGTIIMPISGFMMSALSGHGVNVFGLELVARNPNPSDPTTVLPLNAPIAGLAHITHTVAGYAMIAAILLHIAGAYKHHLIDKDGTMKRILGRSI
jgi:cytochrome b561